MSVQIIQGDARQIPLADRSVQCVVTSPPYWGLRDYGVPGQLGLEKTPEEYVANMVAAFREVRRVLRDDGTLWLNLGDSYCGGGNNRGNGSPISGKQGSNRGATGQVASYGVHKFKSDEIKPKDLVGIPWRVAFALQADGWYLRSDIIWSKPNPMPESVTDRPTKAHEYIFLLSKSPKYYYDHEAVKEPAKYPAGKNGKAPVKSPYGQGFAAGRSQGDSTGGRNRRSVWTITTKPYRGAHFATFPPDLVEPCILAGSRPGDVVLDPFGGSGTTGLVAQQHGRNAVLIELNPNYIALAEQRCGLVPQEAA